MKIAIIGYGKMGKTIERLAEARGHEVVLKTTSSDPVLTPAILIEKHADVAIEFTSPHSAFHNITTIMDAKVPVVSGSTGWLDRWEEALEHLQSKGGAFVYASNFSVGVNIFFALNQHLAGLMSHYPEYQPDIKEIHHTAKKDAPSGTAVTIANDLLQNLGRYSSWSQDPSASDSLYIESIREDPAPGTHVINYVSDIDEIEIKHTAKSRDGFAYGAILAAEYIIGKEGIHTMKDVLGM